jgi:hypothetical protein
MAFDSTIAVLGKPFEERLPSIVLGITNEILSKFGIMIERSVSMKEYETMTSSKEINRYIRVKKTTLEEQKEDATQLVKVGTSRVKAFERFASSKYAFFSISDLEDGKNTVLWFSFHSVLSRVFPEFRDFSYLLTREITARYSMEGYILEASSFSRNSDKFVMYIKGKERNKLSSKGALTEVKNTYGLDINKVMMNVDKNMAIHYAPMDHREVTKEIRIQEKRYSDWKAHRGEIKLENKEDGSNLIETFEKENEVIMNTLRNKKEGVERALIMDPIGSIIYFRMKDLGVLTSYASENERLFGRGYIKNERSKV